MGGAAVTVRVNCLDSLPSLFWARMVNVNVPDWVGSPEITFPDRHKPGGKAPAVMLHVIGVVPVARIIVL